MPIQVHLASGFPLDYDSIRSDIKLLYLNVGPGATGLAERIHGL